MKFQVTFRTPNAVMSAIDDLPEFVPDMFHMDTEGWYEQNKEYDACRQLASRWVKHGEVVTIEFDTEKGTAEVVPVWCWHEERFAQKQKVHIEEEKIHVKSSKKLPRRWY